jgi:hypothetical protein
MTDAGFMVLDGGEFADCSDVAALFCRPARLFFATLLCMRDPLEVDYPV